MFVLPTFRIIINHLEDTTMTDITITFHYQIGDSINNSINIWFIRSRLPPKLTIIISINMWFLSNFRVCLTEPQ